MLYENLQPKNSGLPRQAILLRWEENFLKCLPLIWYLPSISPIISLTLSSLRLSLKLYLMYLLILLTLLMNISFYSLLIAISHQHFLYLILSGELGCLKEKFAKNKLNNKNPLYPKIKLMNFLKVKKKKNIFGILIKF